MNVVLTQKEQWKYDLLQLLKTKAYKKGEFTLSSGMTSEHYINCKSVILSQKGIALASKLLLQHVEEDSVAVAGLTLGADPLVTGVSLSARSGYDKVYGGRELDAFIVRKQPKGHGTGAWIEGPELPKGSKVTVLEDVVSTGGSSVGAVKKLRDHGFIVENIVSIVDRQELGSRAIIEGAGVKLTSLFTLEDLIR